MDNVHDIVVRYHAHDMPFIIHNRHGQVIVVGKQVGDFFLVRVPCYADHILAGSYIADYRARPCQHEIAQGKNSGQKVMLIYHITIIGAFLVFHLAANVGNGLIHGQVVFQEDEIGVHHAGRRIGIEIQQMAEVFRILPVHFFQNGVAALGFQLVQNVGRVVPIHLRYDFGGKVCIQVFQNISRHMILKFGNGVGRVFPGQMAYRVPAFLRA